MTTVTRIAGVAGSIVQLLLATAGTTQAQELAVSCSTERRIIFPSSTYLDVGKLDVAVATASNLPVILQVSADLCVSATAEVRIAYEIDFGEPKIFGPTNIAI